MINMGKFQTVVAQLKSTALNSFSTDISQPQFFKACSQIKQKSNRFHNGVQTPTIPSLSHFKIYGLGMYLFFTFLKYLSVLFVVLSMISVVSMVINIVYGSNYRHSYNSINIIITKTTLGSHKYSLLEPTPQSEHLSFICKMVNVSFDILGCLTFLAFCIWWQYKSKSICSKIQHQIKLPSSYTLQIFQFGQGVYQQEIRQFMGQFGKVTQVVGMRDKAENIQISKQIGEKEFIIKQLQAQTGEEEGSDKGQRIRQIQNQIYELYQKLQKCQANEKPINKFYVQFQNTQQRNKVLRKFDQYQKFYHILANIQFFRRYFNIPQQLYLQNIKPHVQPCKTQPTSILWQTSHISKRKRFILSILQIISSFFVINFSLALVSYISVLIPATESNLQAANYNYQQISAIYASDHKSKIVEAWCIQNYQISGKTSPYANTCMEFWNLMTTEAIVAFCVSMLILTVKKIIESVTNGLSHYQKFQTLSQKSITTMNKLYQMQFLSSNIMTFLAQANLFGISVIFLIKQIIPLPVPNQNDQKNQQKYDNLTSNWYKQVGYQLWLNILILCFMPHIYMPIQYYILQKLAYYQAKKQKLYKKVLLKLQQSEFQLQIQYTNVLFIVSTGFVFGGGIQAMMPIVALCIIARYYYYRFVFVRFCCAPPIYNQSLNDKVISILKFVLIVRCMMSLYMYTAQDVFVYAKQNALIDWLQSLGLNIHSQDNGMLLKLLTTWYYSLFVILMLLVLLFHSLIVKIAAKIKYNRKIGNEYNIDKQNENNNDQNQNQAETAMHIINFNNIQENHRQMVAVTAINQVNMNQNIKQNRKQVQTHHELFSNFSQSQNEQTKEQRQPKIAIKSYKFQCNPLYAQVRQIMNQQNIEIRMKELQNKNQKGKQLKNNLKNSKNKIQVQQLIKIQETSGAQQMKQIQQLKEVQKIKDMQPLDNFKKITEMQLMKKIQNINNIQQLKRIRQINELQPMKKVQQIKETIQNEEYIEKKAKQMIQRTKNKAISHIKNKVMEKVNNIKTNVNINQFFSS